MSQVRQRNSSIELLKIVGIFLIVISHVVQTLSSIPDASIINQNYVLDIEHVTTNISTLLVSMMRYFGNIGNTIFFVCSAWFLLDSKSTNWRKCFQLILDIWIISILILCVVVFLRQGDIGLKLFIKQLFPTTFGNNWFMTCYLIFYAIHQLLNTIIYSVKKPVLFTLCWVGVILYIVLNFFYIGYFFSSAIIQWIVMYFVLAYLKLYTPKLINERKFSISLISVGFIGTFGLAYITNLIGLNFGVLANRLQFWNSPINPFIIMMVFGALFAAKNHVFNNVAINYVSSLSMLIYIIHENMLLRTYYRPRIWEYIYETYGYSHIILWILVLSILIFTFAFICSSIYTSTLKKLSVKVGDRLFVYLSKSWNKISTALMQVD